MPLSHSSSAISGGSGSGSGSSLPNDKFRSQLCKTRPCTFFAKSYCRKGESCRFAHGATDSVKLPNLTKTSLCKDWQHGMCSLPGATCRYAHGKHELRITAAFKDASRHVDETKQLKENAEGQRSKKASKRLKDISRSAPSAAELPTPSAASLIASLQHRDNIALQHRNAFVDNITAAEASHNVEETMKVELNAEGQRSKKASKRLNDISRSAPSAAELPTPFNITIDSRAPELDELDTSPRLVPVTMSWSHFSMVYRNYIDVYNPLKVPQRHQRNASESTVVTSDDNASNASTSPERLFAEDEEAVYQDEYYVTFSI